MSLYNQRRFLPPASVVVSSPRFLCSSQQGDGANPCFVGIGHRERRIRLLFLLLFLLCVLGLGSHFGFGLCRAARLPWRGHRRQVIPYTNAAICGTPLFPRWLCSARPASRRSSCFRPSLNRFKVRTPDVVARRIDALCFSFSLAEQLLISFQARSSKTQLCSAGCCGSWLPTARGRETRKGVA